MSTVTVTAFKWVPPIVQGLVRDLRVRWALDEAGIPYQVKLIGAEDQKSAAYRALQPFGQVPAYEDGGLKLFESGGILLHIAERSPKLMPTDANQRARVRTWLFAALNSIEPPIQNLAEIDLFNSNEAWAKQRRPAVVEMVRARLTDLSRVLADRDYLEREFSVADLLMTTVLRILRHTELVAEVPVLAAYKARCEDRPGFKKALADQLAAFKKYAPKK
jgi:glutathione S-transferase